MTPEIWALLGQGVLETLYMTLVATFFAYLIGLPLGVALVLTDKEGLRPCKVVHAVLGFVVNCLRSIPFVILIFLVFPLTALLTGKTYGATATIVPLVLGAFPFVARVVESSLLSVDKGVVEAAVSMGTSTNKIIFSVLLGESFPSLVSGAALTVATVLGYSAMAGVCGGGGLGAIAINYGYYQSIRSVMFVCVALLIVVVQLLQEAGLSAAKIVNKNK